MYVGGWTEMPSSKDYFCNQNIQLPAHIFVQQGDMVTYIGKTCVYVF